MTQGLIHSTTHIEGGAQSLQIKVLYFTHLREIIGKKEENMTFSKDKAVTVNMVVKILSEKYGAQFNDYVYDAVSGQPKSFLQFLINGTSAVAHNGLNTSLKDGDILAILPPVGGG